MYYHSQIEGMWLAGRVFSYRVCFLRYALFAKGNRA